MNKDKQSLVFRCKEAEEETKELSSFHLQQRWDSKIVDAIVLALMAAFVIPDARNGVVLELIFLAAIVVISLWEKVSCKERFKKSVRYKAGEFQGDIDALILAFARAGLFLDKQVGDKYVFKSGNIISLKAKLVVTAFEDRCLVIGTENSILSLENFFTV